MSRIKVIKHEEASGRLKEIYDELVDKRGKLADVHTIQSLRPESIVKHIDIYLEIMFSKSDLSRAEREMIAVIVSVCNNCEYCQIHHGEALNHYWKNEQRVAFLKKDYRQIELAERELKLCELAESLTLNPGLSKEIDYPEQLRKAGLSDNAILDATLAVSYFNFVNRIVLCLDVGLEKGSITGYKY